MIADCARGIVRDYQEMIEGVIRGIVIVNQELDDLIARSDNPQNYKALKHFSMKCITRQILTLGREGISDSVKMVIISDAINKLFVEISSTDIVNNINLTVTDFLRAHPNFNFVNHWITQFVIKQAKNSLIERVSYQINNRVFIKDT